MPDDITHAATPRPDSITGTAPPAGLAETAFASGPQGGVAGGVVTVPGYEVRGEIARGGMGRVLAAYDLAFGREVAIKVVLPGALSAATARRFVRESRITGRLAHPGIPPAYHLGELDDGSPFLAMKLVRGRTLAALLAERPGLGHELPHFVGVFERVCQAVGYAHAEGVVHRDIKPANVMVGAFGEVQVMDWGLAFARNDEFGMMNEELKGKSADGSAGDSSFTQAGAVMGTPAYMAPEQARGEEVDARADVFALGGLLASVLVGRTPFWSGDAASTLVQAASGDTSEVFSALAGCTADAELVGIARRCLAPARDDRPADGTAVAALVAAYRAGVEARLRTAERDRAAAAVRAVERRKRHRLQLALAAAVGLLFLGGGAAAWWQDRQRHESDMEKSQQAAEKVAEKLRQEAAEAHREAQVQLANAHRDQEVESLLRRTEEAIRASDTRRAAGLILQITAADEGRMDAGRAGRLRRCRTDLDALVRLDEIELVRWQVRGHKYQREEAAAALGEVFKSLGVAPGATPPGEAARAARESLLGDRLRAEMSWWLVSVRGDPKRRGELRDILEQFDQNGFRTSIWGAVAREDWKGVGELLTGPDAETQPAWFVAAVGGIDEVAPGARLAALEAAVRRAPADFAALMSVGRIGYPSRTDTAARRARYCQAATALRPENAAAWYNLGLALRDGGDLDRAHAAFEKAVGLDEQYAAAHVNLGVTRLARGDREGAERAYRKALVADPKYAPAYVNLGNLHLSVPPGSGIGALVVWAKREHRLAMAHEHFVRAVECDEQFAPAYCGRGDVCRARGDWDRAVIEYNWAIDTNPAYAPSHCGLAQVCEARGNLTGAIREYKTAVQKDGDLATGHYLLGLALAKSGEGAKGRDSLRAAFRADPRCLSAHVDLGVMLANERELEGALVHLDTALKHPDAALILYPNWVNVQKYREVVWREITRPKP